MERETISLLHEWLHRTAQLLVDHPDDVVVECATVGRRVILQVRVNSADVGKMIGRNGRTIGQVRGMLSSAGTRVGCQVDVELVEQTTPATQDVFF